MTKVIVLANHKGGTGKTTITQVLCSFFAYLRKKRIIVIDCDPQGNLSNRYIKMHKNPNGTGFIPSAHPDCDNSDPAYQALFRDKNYASVADVFTCGYSISYDTKIDSMELFPVDGHALTEVNKVSTNKEEPVIASFCDFIQSIKDTGEYDLILIDTPPNKYAVTRAAIRASTDTFIVVKPESKSIEGTSDVIEMIEIENRNKNIEEHSVIKGIIVNQWSHNNRSIHNATIDTIKDSPALSKYLLPTYLKEMVDLKFIDLENANPNNPFDFPPTSPIYTQCLALGEMIEERVYGDLK